MNKLLILSTLLFCLTASNKTFSAQEKYRLIQFATNNSKEDCVSLIAESTISLDQINLYRNNNDFNEYTFSFYYDKDYSSFTNPVTYTKQGGPFKIKTILCSQEETRAILLKISGVDKIHILRAQNDSVYSSIVPFNKKNVDFVITELTRPLTSEQPVNDNIDIDDDNIDDGDSTDDDNTGLFRASSSTPQPYTFNTKRDDDTTDDGYATNNINLQSTLLPEEQKEFDNDDDDNDDVQQLSSLQPISSEKEGSMGKASKNEKTDISMDPNNSPFTIGKPEGNTSSNNEEKDDNSSTSSGINSYHIGSVIILVGALFFVVLNWSNLSKSSKEESVDNTH